MCGIAGAYNVPNAGEVVCLMLKAMQHRGQEAAGIVSYDGGRFHVRHGLGLIDEVFGKKNLQTELPGQMAIGHVRYSTQEDDDPKGSTQPLVADMQHGRVAIAHNGNLTNYGVMRQALETKGAIFRTRSDTELFLHLLSRSRKQTQLERLTMSYKKVQGSYSLLTMTNEGIWASMDPHGFRPLSIIPYEDGFLFASETCAFDLFQPDAEPQMIEPGTTVELTGNIPSISSFASRPYTRHCSFEHIYFTRPDSTIFGTEAVTVRKRLGIALAKHCGVETDIVTPVPDSSNAIALAYANELGIEFDFALLRNHYTGRNFITKYQRARRQGIRMKLNAVRSIVEGKSITVIDDSLVRGTTSRKVTSLLRKAGAREIHMRIASPPVKHPCYWGIDTPNRKELIAANSSIARMKKYLNVDSLAYLPEAALLEALGDEKQCSFCTTCFSGVKPVHNHSLPVIK